MKISQSTISMASERRAIQMYAVQTATSGRIQPDTAETEGQQDAATLELSKQSQEQRIRQIRLDWEHQLSMLSGVQTESVTGSTEEDFQIKLIRRFMESLRAMREGRMPDYSKLEKAERQSLSFQIGNRQSFSLSAGQFEQTPVSHVSIGTSGVWKEQVTMSGIFTDREVTSFSTDGKVQTADGRNISFSLNLEMSREFTQATSMEYTRKVFCVDPLVINLEGSPASFTDQTFFFDLDSDGKEEELAQLSSGSGFLALDKNGDGIINDGSELFGTKSGDGFRDLAEYDEDGNGWIDENDSVFEKLKVWTRNQDGTQRLTAIGKAGVGAIYLGKADTQFSLNRLETNETQGYIRSTGIFLKESGEAGTIQHVDLVV